MSSTSGRHSDDEIREALRGAVGDAQFDYDTLVAGTHHRAGRIRRRRAIATGVAVAVLGPALVGGAALVLPEILPGDSGTVAPAGAPESVDATDTPRPDDAAVTSAPVVAEVPWQDGELPQPEGGFEVNDDLPNAWEIPDARPTGVVELDDLGVPKLAMNYPRMVPVSALMTCDPGRADGAEPEAGQSFSFYSDASQDLAIELTVTGWADSVAARDGLLHDSYTLCTWDGVQGEPQEWSGHQGDEDYLLYAAESDRAAAVIRQGDYLVAVTVSEGDEGQNQDVAAEIAAKTAANLAVLDPAHGRD